MYESHRAVNEYLLFHYGKSDDQMKFQFGPKDSLNFPERCASICSNYSERNKQFKTRALDIGCAVGGTSFQLAKYFDEVVGIDYSQHFVDAANVMKDKGKMDFEILKQGMIFETCQTSLDQTIDRSKVTFQQGDACSLDKSLGKFDLIVASNLLCRLPKPRNFLTEITSFLTVGGCLVLISPYSWLEEYTDKSEWIGGLHNTEESITEVSLFMSNHDQPLELSHRQDIPFLIREHERKYQYGVSDCTVWKKTL